ncbi:MAG: FxsA family protein [SAR324 cluster bacterium]|nr:FxsA family protein [SAR324 cluster bacterium]
MTWIVGLLAMLIVPWVEFWLMMGLGFSLVTVTVLGLVTAAVGWWHARKEGLDLWTELESDFQNGRVPTAEALDAMMMVAGGWALIVPGLITDIVGGVLLVPAIRRLATEPIRQMIRVRLR